MFIKKSRIFLVFIIVLLVMSYSFYWTYNRISDIFYSSSLPVTGEQVMVEIPLGASTTDVAKLLERKKVISNALLFRLFVRFKGLDGQLQAGEYSLDSSMTMQDLVRHLTEGVAYKEGSRFTVPEGLTLEALGLLLEEKGLVEDEEFWASVQDEKWVAEFTFLPPYTSNESKYLEGYLFPDTYEVKEEAAADDIVRLMLRQFEKVFFPEFAARAEEMEMSVHEAVTLASIIEREGKVDEERPLISAVFYNRLNREHPMLLQSCATVQYALGEVKPVLSSQDLAVESPYNTYLNPGLPPGPIGAPGKASIRAALYPADVEYLYFVYKEDGSGTHYFSETLEEHNHYRTLVRQNQ